MRSASALSRALAEDLRRAGYARAAGPFDRASYEGVAGELGRIVDRERVALREGAHAYIAKPGPVPLHTDHPDVEIVGWSCEQQDEMDGASILLDAQPFIETLTAEEQAVLTTIELCCPPLHGGPPTSSHPVLRKGTEGFALFCSPWLRAVGDDPVHVDALDRFRERLSAYAKIASLEIRLAPGEALFVDNQRVLHGRGAISPTSRRRLLRLWIDLPCGPA